MKKPPTRSNTERSVRSPKGRRLRLPVPCTRYLEALSVRATFEGSPKHKLSPRAFGMEPNTGAEDDSTYCDADAGFQVADIALVPAWLRDGISAGLIGANDIAGDPSVLWVVSQSGWIFEGRITHPGRAIYHGYAVLPNETIAIAVLERFGAWRRDQAVSIRESEFAAARALYLQ